MKRIKEACLFQTVHFALKEDIPPTIAVRAVQEEYRHYKEQLDRKRIRYQITDGQLEHWVYSPPGCRKAPVETVFTLDPR